MAAGTSASAPGSFCERQKALCLLSSLIEEHEQWMGSLLQKLGWKRDSLQSKEMQAHPTLVQCPVNKHHFIPRASLEEHKQKCRYAVLGVQSDTENVSHDGGFLYDDSVIPCIEIESSVQTAVARLAAESEVSQESVPPPLGPFRRDFIDQSEVTVESRDSLVTKEYFSSLEDSCPSPSEIIAEHPTQVIRFVKAWKLVPQDFAIITLSTLNLGEVKGWLFKHLPQDHAFSTTVGGEMQAVEAIMQWLTPGHDRSIDPLTPNNLMNRLRPLLRLKTRAFVLELWKFIHVSRLQREHGISDSVVEDLTPLTLAQSTEREPSLVERIKALVEQQPPSDGESALPLPMDHVRCTLSTKERRILYDYVVECTAKSRNLDRYDQTGVKMNKPGEGGGGGGDAGGGGGGGGEDKRKYLETLIAERDYKRRRQTYRAKNVRITKRTPVEVSFMDTSVDSDCIHLLVLTCSQATVKASSDSQQEDKSSQNFTTQIFRDIIEAGMEEIAASQQRQVGELPDAVGSGAEGIHPSIDQSSSSPERDTLREVSSLHSRSQRNRSRSRSRDRPSKHRHSERDKRDKRSATPRRSRKKSESPKRERKERKSRKHRHHSSSHSNSRGQSRERDSRKRSRSHSRSRRKHRHKSKSRSKSRDRERRRHKSKSRSKSRDRERRRHKSKSRSKSRDRERHRHKSKSRSKSRDRERRRHKSKSRSKSRDRERHRHRSRSPNRLHSSSRIQDKIETENEMK